MKAIRADLPMELEQVRIHTFADLHIGDPNCNLQRIQDWIKAVEEDEHAYCILNGDLMDTAITASVGDTYGAVMTPMEQCEVIVELFGTLAKQGKILGVCGGNHEARIYKHTGIDTTKLAVAQLGITDKYTDTTGVIFLRFGKSGRGRPMSYSIYFSHGSGGGRKVGGKLNRLADYATIVDTDIYVCSHTHLPATFKQSYYRCDYRNRWVTKVDKLFVNTAAQLEYGGYGDKQGYVPSATDNPIIILDGRQKKMRCIV